MKTIRRRVFETNSSSTHSICVTSTTLLDQKKDHIDFTLNDFGWEYDKLNTPYEKAAYLYTGIVCNDLQDALLPKLKQFLDRKEMSYSFENPIQNDFEYIDHCDEVDDIVKEICSDEDKLMKYLFSSESFILTGNDNGSSDVDINVEYPHEEFYKGN